MEALSSILGPFQEKILVVAIFFTVLHFFSGLIICRQIYRSASTNDVSAVPFVTSVVMAVLMLKYAHMTNDVLMMELNALALLLNSIYLIVYLWYTINRERIYTEVLKPFVMGAILWAMMFCYTLYEDPVLVRWRFAFITAIFMLTLLAWPLLDVRKIFEGRYSCNVDPTSAMLGFAVSVLWLLYSLAIKNVFMVVQNSICTILCTLQFFLALKFPETPENNTS